MPRPFHRPTAGAFLFGRISLAASRNGLTIVKECQTDQIAAISAKPVPIGSLQAGAMARETDKSRRYLRWAAANEGRAARAPRLGRANRRSRTMASQTQESARTKRVGRLSCGLIIPLKSWSLVGSGSV